MDIEKILKCRSEYEKAKRDAETPEERVCDGKSLSPTMKLLVNYNIM